MKFSPVLLSTTVAALFTPALGCVHAKGNLFRDRNGETTVVDVKLDVSLLEDCVLDGSTPFSTMMS
jgi:hypothetical protein